MNTLQNGSHEVKDRQECCPQFDPIPWDNKEFSWDKKRFVKDKVCTLFYMPINFGRVMKRVQEKIKQSGATVQEGMWLSDHTSKWNMDLYVAVDREVAGLEHVALSGTFFSKVYEGNFKDTGKWTQDFENGIKGKGASIKKMYMWYTTCPTCAKKYGKNYVVIIGQTE